MGCSMWAGGVRPSFRERADPGWQTAAKMSTAFVSRPIRLEAASSLYLVIQYIRISTACWIIGVQENTTPEA